MGKLGVVADIRKAFLMIEVQPADRDFLRFLWWNKEGNHIVYRHKRVVFGVNSSPFLLDAVLRHHISQVTDGRQANAQKLLKSLYVDNCVTSCDSTDEFENFKTEATGILAEAKMELRQWASTVTSDKGAISSTRNAHSYEASATPVLGMKWDTTSDLLYCDFQNCVLSDKVTKRVILSSVQSVFDPVGYLCPILILPKMILQEVWISKIGWDEELSDQVTSKFRTWWEELKSVGDIRIPRNVTVGSTDQENWEIHCFCDASKAAFAACVFLRCSSDKGVTTQLLQAKARASPIKTVTIPRLELMACLIGARLTRAISTALDVPNIKKTYWSDSSTAVSWIKRNNDWGTFVGNRVREILELSDAAEWKFVPGPLNPADLPSRGCTAGDLRKFKWWEGPNWLREEQSTWPQQKFSVDEELVTSELKKCSVASSTAAIIQVPWFLKRFSSFRKNVRVIAWLNRFFENSRSKSVDRRKGEISIKEMENAEITILKLVQNEIFTNGVSPKQIETVKDDQGLLRVKTRILDRDDSIGFRLPILLPNAHPVVDQIIRETHIQNCHGGIQFLMGILREKYWILQGRRAVRKLVSKCVRCRRFASKSCGVTSLPALPLDRVKDAKPFEVTGVDLAGPLFLKSKEKVWIMLATCAVFRCVHLELLSSLSTAAFLLAFRRFVDRRGRPSVVYSDNGTNFVGAENLFASLDWKQIEQEFSVKRIVWRFNPPSAAWWGGWWERLIRSMKDILKRIIGKGVLTFEELSTCVCDAEAIVNARPLTYVTEDPGDLIPLTPSMFLQGMTEVRLPETEELKGTVFERQYRHLTRVREELKTRFRKEYLSLLIQRQSEKPLKQLEAGDIVLIGSDNAKRLDWPIGKVIEIMPGKDGITRVVKLRTATGTLLRPVQRLFPLEVSREAPELQSELSRGTESTLLQEDEIHPKQSDISEDERTPSKTVSGKKTIETRSGRIVRKPKRFE